MTEQNVQTEMPTTKKNPYTIWFVVLSFVAPVALAYIMFYFVDVTSFNNHGEIYKPVVDISRLELTDAEGNALEDKEIRYKWRFYSFIDNSCDQACQQRLIEVRQLHKAFGKNAHRILRYIVFLETPSKTLKDFIDTELPEANSLYGKRETIYNSLGIVDEKNGIFISDPMGNVMMRFRQEQPMKELQFDMKKLLKASQIG